MTKDDISGFRNCLFTLNRCRFSLNSLIMQLGAYMKIVMNWKIIYLNLERSFSSSVAKIEMLILFKVEFLMKLMSGVSVFIKTNEMI